jgi:putative transposase
MWIVRARSSSLLSGELNRSSEPEPAPQIPLMPFQSGPARVPVLPYRLQDYLWLVDWTGRAIQADKRGAINTRLPPIIQQLNIDADADACQLAMQPRRNVFGRAMGRLDHLRLYAKTLGQSCIKCVRAAEALYD